MKKWIRSFKIVAYIGMILLCLVWTAEFASAFDQNAVNTLKNPKVCIACDLSEADLSSCVISDFNLTKANLFRADLTGAILTGAILDGATGQNGKTCKTGSKGACKQ